MFLFGGQRLREREATETYSLVNGKDVPNDWATPLDADDLYTIEQATADGELSSSDVDHDVAVHARRSRHDVDNRSPDGTGGSQSSDVSDVDAEWLFEMACRTSEDEADGADADDAMTSSTAPSAATNSARHARVVRIACCVAAIVVAVAQGCTVGPRRMG